MFVFQEEFNIKIHMAKAECRKSQEKTLELAKIATSEEMPKEGTCSQGKNLQIILPQDSFTVGASCWNYNAWDALSSTHDSPSR